jgi:RecA-family ATPase
MSTEYEQLLVIREWVKEIKIEWGFDPNHKPMKTITLKEFSKLELPKEQWLIKNILPREGFVIIASPSGEKKTWTSMTMAGAVANGTNFLGNKDFSSEKGNVLYIDEEMSDSEIQRRIKLLGLDETSATIHLASRNNLDFSDEKMIQELYEFVEQNQIRVVFIDTLRSVAGGLKEDKAEEVRAFLDKFKEFKNKGVVIVFLDHCRKPAHFEGKIPKKEQLLGSQDKLASVETLHMVKSEEGNEILFYTRKSRNGREYSPFKIEMREIVDENLNPIKIELVYTGKIEEKEYMLDQAKGFVMDLLLNEGKKRQEIIEILKKEKKIGEKNISEAIRELEHKDRKIKMIRIGRENYYEINNDLENEDQKTKTDDLFDGL